MARKYIPVAQRSKLEKAKKETVKTNVRTARPSSKPTSLAAKASSVTAKAKKQEINIDDEWEDTDIPEYEAPTSSRTTPKNPVPPKVPASPVNSAVSMKFSEAIKLFDLKPVADLFLESGLDYMNLFMSPNVTPEFQQVLAAGLRKVGVAFQPYDGRANLYNFSKNYDIKQVVGAIVDAAKMYRLSVKMTSNGTATTDVDMARAFQKLLASK